MRAQSKDNETKSQTKLFTTITPTKQPTNLPTSKLKKENFIFPTRRPKKMLSFFFIHSHKQEEYFLYKREKGFAHLFLASFSFIYYTLFFSS